MKTMTIEATDKCMKCYEDGKKELCGDTKVYDITVKDGLIVCMRCGTPITSDIEIIHNEY